MALPLRRVKIPSFRGYLWTRNAVLIDGLHRAGDRKQEMTMEHSERDGGMTSQDHERREYQPTDFIVLAIAGSILLGLFVCCLNGFGYSPAGLLGF
jgi:hypothetical protein